MSTSSRLGSTRPPNRQAVDLSSIARVRSPAEPSRFGFCYPRFGSRSGPLQAPPANRGRALTGVIDRVVIVEVLLSFLRHEAKEPEMHVGHERPSLGSGIWIDTATASGSEWGTSSSLNS
jgi:hypothetical protein